MSVLVQLQFAFLLMLDHCLFLLCMPDDLQLDARGTSLGTRNVYLVKIFFSLSLGPVIWEQFNSLGSCFCDALGVIREVVTLTSGWLPLSTVTEARRFHGLDLMLHESRGCPVWLFLALPPLTLIPPPHECTDHHSAKHARGSGAPSQCSHHPCSTLSRKF